MSNFRHFRSLSLAIFLIMPVLLHRCQAIPTGRMRVLSALIGPMFGPQPTPIVSNPVAGIKALVAEPVESIKEDEKVAVKKDEKVSVKKDSPAFSGIERGFVGKGEVSAMKKLIERYGKAGKATNETKKSVESTLRTVVGHMDEKKDVKKDEGVALRTVDNQKNVKDEKKDEGATLRTVWKKRTVTRWVKRLVDGAGAKKIDQK